MKCLFKKLFSLEGNIGAGKTTLLNLLAKNIPNSLILSEPVGDWKSVGGENLLNCFYLEPKRWCFTFEVYSMISKLKNLKEALKSDAEVIIMERSLYSDKSFHNLSYFLDKLDVKEMKILQDLYNNFMKEYPGFNGIIFLNTDIKTCMDRIKKRGRKEEAVLTEDYLKKLDDQLQTIEYRCPKLEVDGKYDTKKPQMTLQLIKEFIKNN
jgi:deoxyadenosine/deoxycytidine kinase